MQIRWPLLILSSILSSPSLSWFTWQIKFIKPLFITYEAYTTILFWSLHYDVILQSYSNSNEQTLTIGLGYYVSPTCSLTDHMWPSFPGYTSNILPNDHQPLDVSDEATKAVSSCLMSFFILYLFCHGLKLGIHFLSHQCQICLTNSYTHC